MKPGTTIVGNTPEVTSTKRQSTLDKLLAPPTWRRKPTVKPERKPQETAAQANMRAAREADRRRYENYLTLRAHKLATLLAEHPNASRYVAGLKKIGPDVETYSGRDCDTDLSELVTRLGLFNIKSPYERFLLFEVTAAWLKDLSKGQKTYRFDDPEPFPPDDPEPTTLDEVKHALRLV